MKQIVMLSGANACGKTAILNWLLPFMQKNNQKISICKFDCVDDSDCRTFQKFNIPVASGISHDICPDHFLVSNFIELYQWSKQKDSDYLFIETAGLCNRCSPATKNTLSLYVIDSTCSTKAPSHMGPMLTKADLIILTKIDMISQAEKEIIYFNIQKENPNAKIFCVDSLSGYGIESIGRFILTKESVEDFDHDSLRHTMPSGVCSYCLGERRIGSAYQQGCVEKIAFQQEDTCIK